MSSDFDSFDQDDADGFIESTLGARSWPATGTIWAFTANVTILKLFSSDFSVDFSATPFTQAGRAVGGTDRRVWASERLTTPTPDETKTYELDPADLSIVRSVAGALFDCRGIGGSKDFIWGGKTAFIEMHELSVSNFSVIRTVATITVALSGVGGMGDVIWAVTENLGGAVREYSEFDLVVIRSTTAPDGSPKGIGGTSNVIWYSSGFNTRELDPSDFSVIRTVGDGYTDIGGI